MTGFCDREAGSIAETMLSASTHWTWEVRKMQDAYMDIGGRVMQEQLPSNFLPERKPVNSCHWGVAAYMDVIATTPWKEESVLNHYCLTCFPEAA